MATVSQRPQTDKTIDLDCIKININGLPNDASNARCADNNENKDGFVYTSSTYTDDDGASYKYNYAINKESGVFADIIKGAPATDVHRAANAIRNAGDTKSEAIVNAKKVWGNNAQFNGRSTPTNDFIYNEGYSSTLGNGANDAQTFQVQSTGTDGQVKYENVSFYDKNTAAYSNQLIAVRQLADK